MRFMRLVALLATAAGMSAGAASATLPPQARANGNCGLQVAIVHAADAAPFSDVEIEECEREHGGP